MEKAIALAIALVLTLGLTACGGSSRTTAPTSGGDTAATAQSNEPAATQPSPTPAPSEDAVQLSSAPSGSPDSDADGEFIYAQLGTSMNPTDPSEPVYSILGFDLIFSGENENLPYPKIEKFELYKDGESQGASFNDTYISNGYIDGEYPFADIEDREVVRYVFYLAESIDGPSAGEYWCEMMVNGVYVRTSTFVWHDDGSYEFLDDFTLPEASISIAPEGDSRIGYIIPFGNYEWRIFDVQDGMAFVLSEYILNVMPFHNSAEDATWETSSLRSYLNGEFYGSFSDEERSRILEATINCDNPFCNIYGGNETTDKVFLLSAEEVIKYLLWDSGEFAEESGYPVYRVPYAKETLTSSEIGADGEPTRNGESDGAWWLRTMGEGITREMFSGESRAILTAGGSSLGGADWFELEQTLKLISGTCGVRPAMWIALEDEAIGGIAPSSAPRSVEQPSETATLMNAKRLEITLQMSNREEPYDGIYNGEVLDNLPHGQGTFETVNSVGMPRTYIGEWHEGHFDGDGRWEHSGHLKFEGTFENDRMVSGKMYNLSGSLYYEGEFRDGLRMEDTAALKARIDGYAAEAVPFSGDYWNHLGQIVVNEHEVAEVIPDGSSVVLRLYQANGNISSMNYYPAYGEVLPQSGDRILGYCLAYEDTVEAGVSVFQDFLGFTIL